MEDIALAMGTWREFVVQHQEYSSEGLLDIYRGGPCEDVGPEYVLAFAYAELGYDENGGRMMNKTVQIE